MPPAAEVFIDTPRWDAAAPLAMAASYGTFDEAVEAVEVAIDTTGLTKGRHILFVQARTRQAIPAPCASTLRCFLGLRSDPISGALPTLGENCFIITKSGVYLILGEGFCSGEICPIKCCIGEQRSGEVSMAEIRSA